MPQQDVSTIFFQAFSNLSGGLITDLTTLLTALFFIAFILMGFNLIRLQLVVHIDERKTDSELMLSLSNKENNP